MRISTLRLPARKGAGVLCVQSGLSEARRHRKLRMQRGGGGGDEIRVAQADTANKLRSGGSGGSGGFLRGPLAYRFSFLRLVLAEAAQNPGGLGAMVCGILNVL